MSKGYTGPKSTGNQNPIAAARVAAGLTQAQLAERVGRSQKLIASWESGARHPKLSSLVLLASALGVDPFSLADIKNESGS